MLRPFPSEHKTTTACLPFTEEWLIPGYKAARGAITGKKDHRVSSGSPLSLEGDRHAFLHVVGGASCTCR